MHDRGRALAAGPAATEKPARPPLGLRATLRPYQQEGLRWLQHLRAHGAGGILADDMGLGKTLQTIAHLVAEKEAGRLDLPALIVAPTSVVGNWRRELGRFAPALRVRLVRGAERRYQWADVAPGRCDVVLTTYPVLVRDDALLASRQFSSLILDEAQAIKNRRSQAHQAAARVQARHRLCLSGTPIENNLGELWALFEFLKPGLLGDADWFRHRFREPDRARPRSRAAACAARPGGAVHPAAHEGRGRARPAAQDRDRPPRRAARRAARSLREHPRGRARRGPAADRKQGDRPRRRSRSSTRCMQAAPGLLRPAPARAARPRGEVRESAKYDVLLELLEQQLGQGRRVLVFSQFARMLGLIGAGSRRARHRARSTLTGATADRQQPIDAFERARPTCS